MRKHTIEVDEDVFEALQDLATPLVDTPNTVLRRLLVEGPGPRKFSVSTNPEPPLHVVGEPPTFDLLAGPRPAATRRGAGPRPPDIDRGPYSSLGHELRGAGGMSPRRFGKILCAREFPGEMFERARRERGAFRTMFESEERLLYFLNFNKPDSPNLWYKVPSTALDALLGADKPGFVVFANPAERVAWLIPIRRLAAKHLEAADEPLGGRDVDLNIDPRGDRLRELDWDIADYRREI